MAHVDLALSESFVPQPRQSVVPVPVDDRRSGLVAADAVPTGSLGRWSATVVGAAEPCMVVSNTAIIVAASTACHDLLNLGPFGTAVGRHLLDGVVRLVDFTAARDELVDVEFDKIPPLLALSSGRMARGLMRIHDGGAYDVTVDAIATPLYDGPSVVGSLTFFAAI